MPLRDPLAMIAFLGLPAALIGVGCGVDGLKSNTRSQAVVGLVLYAACVAAWTIMATVAYSVIQYRASCM